MMIAWFSDSKFRPPFASENRCWLRKESRQHLPCDTSTNPLSILVSGVEWPDLALPTATTPNPSLTPGLGLAPALGAGLHLPLARVRMMAAIVIAATVGQCPAHPRTTDDRKRVPHKLSSMPWSCGVGALTRPSIGCVVLRAGSPSRRETRWKVSSPEGALWLACPPAEAQSPLSSLCLAHRVLSDQSLAQFCW